MQRLTTLISLYDSFSFKCTRVFFLNKIIRHFSERPAEALVPGLIEVAGMHIKK